MDIWFAEDIHNALLAANEASASTAAVMAEVCGDVITLQTYREGYKAALSTLALAFGLSPAIIIGERRMVVKPVEWSIQMMVLEEENA